MSEPIRLTCEHLTVDGRPKVYDDGRAWTPTTGDPPPDGCMVCHTKLVIAPMLARGFRPPPIKRPAKGVVAVGTKPKATPVPVPVGPPCAYLGVEPVRIAGSSRVWLKCYGGYGSTIENDPRKGLVADCDSSCHLPATVWRVGGKCGSKCPGYERPPNGTPLPDLPAAPADVPGAMPAPGRPADR